MRLGTRVFTTILISLCLSLISGNALAQTISIEFTEAAYQDIFETIGKLGQFNVLVDSSVSGKGSFTLDNVEPLEAVELISNSAGLDYRVHGSTVFVTAKGVIEEYQEKEIHFTHIKHISGQSVNAALSLIIPSSDIHIHEETGLVILFTDPDTFTRAETILKRVDQPGRISVSARQQSVIDVFHELSQELQLNLVADPRLAEQSIVLESMKIDPWELIEYIQTVTAVEVKQEGNTLIVSLPAEVEAPREPERIKVHRLSHVEPESANLGLQMILPSDKIQMDPENRSIIFRGTEAQLAEAEEFLKDVDQPLPQVLLEVWVQEMTTDVVRNLGVEWKGVPSFSGGTSAPTFLELSWEPWELIWALRALEEQGEAKLLASPKIATLSGKEASIFVGDQVPITEHDEEGAETVRFLDIGITLDVTPTISSDGYITILVRPEVSTFFYQADANVPTIRTRQAETTVRVKDGQPVVLGGLLREEEQEQITKVPFISELPILGRLFQWQDKQTYKTEMHIFMIPRIITGEEGIAYSTDFYSTTK